MIWVTEGLYWSVKFWSMLQGGHFTSTRVMVCIKVCMEEEEQRKEKHGELREEKGKDEEEEKEEDEEEEDCIETISLEALLLVGVVV